ncbi:unnamed protein product [Darwinula stevensoni]|uniref:TLC domain-containing protein n=1 Tax=Darwinula stevensoni TaxID=69355 RepID=A0A7R8XG56_9CRUS|nr:unnamed protein product [Darwinula stevensoni]CAG0889411.1 unnamed protein product [Darwinula stevensoni]
MSSWSSTSLLSIINPRVLESMEALERIQAVVWKEEFWLPRNVTWEDMKSKPGRPMPEFQDLLYIFPISISFLIFRIFLETFVLDPLAKATVPMFSVVALLKKDVMGKVNGHIQHNGSVATGRKWNSKTKQGHKGVEKAKLQLQKLRETGFRFVTYSFLFLYGIWTMSDKSWLRDVELCFENIPFHAVTLEVRRYYMLEIGFYLSLSLTLVFDVKRKDFLAQMTHHVVTIVLLMGSWIVGAIRIGTLVLIVHDCADVFLEV